MHSNYEYTFEELNTANASRKKIPRTEKEEKGSLTEREPGLSLTRIAA